MWSSCDIAVYLFGTLISDGSLKDLSGTFLIGAFIDDVEVDADWRPVLLSDVVACCVVCLNWFNKDEKPDILYFLWYAMDYILHEALDRCGC